MTAMPPIAPSCALPVVAGFTIPETNQELGEALTRLAGHINAAQYRFLKLLAPLVEREAWLGDSGMKSPAHWLNYYCGIDLGAAREKVRVALCLATLPLIDAAFSTGVISYSKVRAMTRSATPENEAFLLQVARHGTAQHVEKLVRTFTRASRLADPQQDRCQYEARAFSWYHDDDGMLVFKGRLPAAEGAAFLKAMEVILHTLGQQEPAHQEATNHERMQYEVAKHEPANDESTNDESAVGESTTPNFSSRKVFNHDATTLNPFPGKSFNHDATTLNPSARKRFNHESANDQPPDYEPIDPISHAPAHEQSRDAEFMVTDVSAETSIASSAPTFSQKRADALVAMADLALAGIAADGKLACTADKYQLMIHIDANTSKHVSAETSCLSHCTLDSDSGHFPLAGTTARRLACDAALVTVLEDAAGNVLNVGRKTRTIPPSIRRALTLRDQGCRFPGCCETRFVDAHHIHHWCDGGETRLDNLILLCRHHHTLLHQKGFALVQGTAGWEFVRADGRKLAHALATQFTEIDECPDGSLFIETDSVALGLYINARTAVTLWEGEAMDYDFAVGTLMDIAAVRARQSQQMV